MNSEAAIDVLADLGRAYDRETDEAKKMALYDQWLLATRLLYALDWHLASYIRRKALDRLGRLPTDNSLGRG